jgi:hypothetical protein
MEKKKEGRGRKKGEEKRSEKKKEGRRRKKG